MDTIREELIQDLRLEPRYACPQCVIDRCAIGDCEWDDGEGGICDEPHHRERILRECYRIGGFSLWKKWRMKLRFGEDIKETEDYPELYSLIDDCLWHHEDAKKFDEIILYCSENGYDIFQSEFIHQPFYMDNEKVDILRKYPRYAFYVNVNLTNQ